jgi:hypothetical protein
VIPIANNSAGPKEDILVPEEGPAGVQLTGFLASTLEEYTDAITKVGWDLVWCNGFDVEYARSEVYLQGLGDRARRMCLGFVVVDDLGISHYGPEVSVPLAPSAGVFELVILTSNMYHVCEGQHGSLVALSTNLKGVAPGVHCHSDLAVKRCCSLSCDFVSRCAWRVKIIIACQSC